MTLGNIITGTVTWSPEIERALAVVGAQRSAVATSEQIGRAALRWDLRGADRAVWIAVGTIRS